MSEISRCIARREGGHCRQDSYFKGIRADLATMFTEIASRMTWRCLGQVNFPMSRTLAYITPITTLSCKLSPDRIRYLLHEELRMVPMPDPQDTQVVELISAIDSKLRRCILRAHLSFNELLDMYKSEPKELDINPTNQRLFQWSGKGPKSRSSRSC